MAGQYRFKDQNGNIVAQISASVGGAIAFSGSVVDFTQANNVILGNVQLAGTASNALLLDGFDSQAFAFTSSIHPFTASIAGTNTFTSSATARLNSIETITASNVSRLNAVETITASNIARLNSIETITSSNVSRLNSIETITSSNVARLNSLEIKTGSLATTGSNTFIGTQTITGSLYISSDLIVQGSSSLQNITASAVSIGTNIINLNTANPAIRYAGLVIGDSGSIGSSGSFLYDSVQDEMIFVHRGANTTMTSSVVLMGPQTFDNIGNETYPTSNYIQKGTGNEHLVDSCIFDNGTTVCVNANLRGSSTISGTSLRSNGVGTFGFNTANNGEFQIYGTALDGIIMAGRGSSNDMVITNKNGSDVFRIPTGTIISNFIGNVCAPSFVLANGNCITAIRNTGGASIGVLGFTSGTDTLFIKGGTSGAAASIQFQDTGGTMATFYNCRLGIGTITPGTALEVVSKAADADRTIPHNVLTLTAEQGNAPYGFFGGAILFKNRSYTSGLVESARIRSVIYDDGAPANCGGGLWFETTPTPGGTLTPSLVLDYRGNIGVGTSSPNIYGLGFTKQFTISNTDSSQYANFTIAGGSNASGGVDFGNQTIRHAGVYGLDGSNLGFYTNGTNSGNGLLERMRITSCGNILATGGRISNARCSGGWQEWVAKGLTLTNNSALALFCINGQYDNLIVELAAWVDQGAWSAVSYKYNVGYNAGSSYTAILGPASSICGITAGTTYNETWCWKNCSGSNINNSAISLRIFGMNTQNNVSNGGADLIISNYLTRVS